eukprot:COSAG01_NODE_8503_length_2761_cov_2.343351_5_plen_135_part_00
MAPNDASPNAHMCVFGRVECNTRTELRWRGAHVTSSLATSLIIPFSNHGRVCTAGICSGALLLLLLLPISHDASQAPLTHVAAHDEKRGRQPSIGGPRTFAQLAHLAPHTVPFARKKLRARAKAARAHAPQPRS